MMEARAVGKSDRFKSKTRLDVYTVDGLNNNMAVHFDSLSTVPRCRPEESAVLSICRCGGCRKSSDDIKRPFPLGNK